MTEFFGVLALISCILLVIAVREVHKLRKINAALEQSYSRFKISYELAHLRVREDKEKVRGAQAIRDSLIT